MLKSKFLSVPAMTNPKSQQHIRSWKSASGKNIIILFPFSVWIVFTAVATPSCKGYDPKVEISLSGGVTE